MSIYVYNAQSVSDITVRVVYMYYICKYNINIYTSKKINTQAYALARHCVITYVYSYMAYRDDYMMYVFTYHSGLVERGMCTCPMYCPKRIRIISAHTCMNT